MLFEQDHVACVPSAPGGKGSTIILNFMPGGLKTNWGNLIRSKNEELLSLLAEFERLLGKGSPKNI